MQGPKTHEQQLRILEKKPDVPDGRQMNRSATGTPSRPARDPTARQSEFPVSRGGMNQESDHNKHSEGGQRNHEPQRRTPAQEKQDK